MVRSLKIAKKQRYLDYISRCKRRKIVWFLISCIFAGTIIFRIKEHDGGKIRWPSIDWLLDHKDSSKGNGNCIDFHKLSCKEPYRSRLVRVQKLCATLPKKNYTLTSKTFKYSDNAKLVMCETPKVASTTWQTLLLRLDGFKENISNEILRQWQYERIPNKQFKNLADAEARRRVRHYTSFLITRHPFERLVSAYLDKFTGDNTFYYQHSYGRQIALYQAREYLYGMRNGTKLIQLKEKEVKSLDKFKELSKQQQEQVLQYREVMLSGQISFFQFVRFLVDLHHSVKRSRFDHHWRPQVDLCMPCAFQYSYMMKFENISHESARLLNYVQQHQRGQAEKIEFTKKEKPRYRILTRRKFKEIPENFVKILRKIFKNDFLFYNYNPFLYRGY